jgi:glycosyltransferase involved in cell wall biosynthesis
MSSLRFSLLICTYNRAVLLPYCLNSLAQQSPVDTDWELIVIDNNSTDTTRQVVEDFLNVNPSIQGRYLLEAEQGLSHARNRGYREANSDWVIYLDDDAKAAPDFLQRTLWLIERGGYRIVGGVYYPWYHFGRPRWYKDRYANNVRKETTLCVPPSNYVATGGVMLWERALLIDLGGFDPRVGMVGTKLAYGEETYLQAKARARGIAVAYDPKLVIYHVVMAQKLHVRFFFRAYFAAGRDAVIAGKIGVGIPAISCQLILGIVVMLKDLLIYTPQLLRDDYYVENWTIDVFRKVAKRLGSVYTIITHRNDYSRLDVKK